MTTMMTCAICGRPAGAKQCNGDLRIHHHGKVHTAAGDTAALCADHWREDKEAWEKQRRSRA